MTEERRIRTIELRIDGRHARMVADQLRNGLGGIEEQAARTNDSLGRMSTGLNRIERTLINITKFTAFYYLANRALNAAYAIEEAAESVSLLNRRLTNITNDATALRQVEDMAYDLGVSMDDLGGAVTRFAVASKNAFSTEQILEWQKGLVTSARNVGSTTQETVAGLRQLTQAFSAGKLAGDEYRSITENLPALYTVMREEAEKTGRVIKDMARNGEIDIQFIVNSLNILTEQSKDMSNVNDTLAASVLRRNNAWAMFVNKLGEGQSVFKDLNNYLADMMFNLARSNDMFSDLRDIVHDVNAWFGLWQETLGITNNELDNFGRLIQDVGDGFVEFSQILATRGFDFFLKAMKELPINFKTAIEIMIGEYLKMKAMIDGASQELWLQLKQGFSAVGGFIENIWLNVKLEFAKMADSIIDVYADMLNSMGDALDGVWGMGSASEGLKQSAKALRSYATATEAVEKEINKATVAQKKSNALYDAEISKVQKLALSKINAIQDGIEYNLKQRDARLKNLELLKEEYEWDKKLTALLDEAIEQEKQNIEQMEKKAGVLGKTVDAQQDYTKELKEIANWLTKIQTPLETFERQLEKIDYWLMAGLINDEQWEKLFNDIQATFGKASKTIDEHTDKVKVEVPEAYKNAATSIQRSFTGLFKNIFDGGEDAFESFADSLKNIFTTMLAEMATMAIARPIIVPMMNTVGSALGVPGGAQGGIGGQLGGGNFGSLTNMLGGNNYSMMLAGNNALSNLGFSNTSIGFGGSNLAIGGAGLLGGLVAGQIFDGEYSGMLGGIGSSVGYSLGAGSLASLGMAAGPIGAIAGMIIGGLLGDVFGGNSDTTPDLNLGAIGSGTNGQPRFDSNDLAGTVFSKFGNTSFSTQHDAFDSESDAMAFADSLKNSITPYDDIIAATVGEEVSQAIISGMSDFDRIIKAEESGDWEGSLKDFFNDRFGRISDIIGGEFDSIFDIFDSYNEGVTAAAAYVNSTDEVQSVLMSFWTDQKASIADMVGENETFVTTSLRLVGQLDIVNNHFDMLGLSMLDISTESALLTNQLIQQAGGLDALNAKTSFYYNNFYSDEEKRNNVISNASTLINKFNEEFGEFGTIALGSTASLRQFVDGLGEIDHANLSAYNAAMNLAPALVNSANAMEANRQTALSMYNSMAEIQNNYLNVLSQYDPQAAMDVLADKWSVAIADWNNFVYGLGDPTLNQYAINTGSVDTILASFQHLLTTGNSWLTDNDPSNDAWGQGFVDAATAFMNDWQQFQQWANLLDVDPLQEVVDDVEYSFGNIGDSALNLADQLTNAGNTILGFVNNLTAGNLSPLTPMEKLDALSTQFTDYYQLVQGGDLGAVSSLTSTASSYLQTARDVYASSGAYTAIYDSVVDWLTDLGLDLGGTFPSYNVGSSYIQKDMLAGIHQGEMIIDPQSAGVLRKYGINVNGTSNKEVVEAVNRLTTVLENSQKAVIHQGAKTEQAIRETAKSNRVPVSTEGIV